MKKELSSIENPFGVVYSSLKTKCVVGEQFITSHGLYYILSGNLNVIEAGRKYTFGAGDILFYQKHFLAKFIKAPQENQSFKSIAVVFDRNSLLEFSSQHHMAAAKKDLTNDNVLKLENNILIENYFKTLLPYFDSPLPESLVNLKRQEALMLLLQAAPDLKNVLFDFSQPQKIDLESFMLQNFHFNVDLKRLAYLTGRSLAAFKRDFGKIFHTSPNRWLQKRRLEEAYYLIKEQNKRPSEIYQEVGFESLSHFSYSFKQHFGINPSSIQ
ncbi:Exoenzyme S synthesis regulatory protein ExsA [compost metagenome]